MDKILVSPDGKKMQVTNDGATILKSIAVDNAAAKILIEISRVQDAEIGDGTTSVCVLAAELLRQAERLVGQQVHPQTIVEGFRAAAVAAAAALEATATDNSACKPAFEADLLAIASTTLSSKVLAQHKALFAKMAVDAVLRVGGAELERIQIIKKLGGRLADSLLADGFLLDKQVGCGQPKRLENARILLANTPMDSDKVKLYGSQLTAESTGQLALIERAERERMREKVAAMAATGINCFINRQLIYDWPAQLFADAGILSIAHADFEGIERLALVTGGEIASTFGGDIRLGACPLIEQVVIGEDTLLRFACSPTSPACSIVLRGGTQQLLEEAERSMHDALCVLTATIREPRTTLGGGAAEMAMAAAVDVAAAVAGCSGKQAMAMEAFAVALRRLPEILAANGGYDAGELVGQLKAVHARQQEAGSWRFGLDMQAGAIADMAALGVTESLRLKRQVLLSAVEAAEMIIRVDHIIKAAPRKREACH